MGSVIRASGAVIKTKKALLTDVAGSIAFLLILRMQATIR